MKPRWLSALGLLFLITANLETTSAQQTKRPFTVADEIELTLFGDPNGGPPQVHFSPDGRYFAVWSERGSLSSNSVQDSLRFYSTQEVEDFVGHADSTQPPSPMWVVTRYGKEGPVINANWRWLADSSGVAFLERSNAIDHRLVLADLRKRKIESLTSKMEEVANFDIRDRHHYVYAAVNPAEGTGKMQIGSGAPATVGTGSSLSELLFPGDPVTLQYVAPRSYYLWAVIGRNRFVLKANGQLLQTLGYLDFALSPDGRSVVTQIVVSDVPASWETLYPPPLATSSIRIRAGHQDLRSGLVREYVRIDLQTGSVQSLTDAPTISASGWSALGGSSWSNDGRAVLLPGTFLSSKDEVPSRPCVAVVDLSSNTRSCVEIFQNPSEEGHHLVHDVQFTDGDKHRVTVSFTASPGYLKGKTEYLSKQDGTWQLVGETKGEKVERNGLQIAVDQAFDRSPKLVATANQVPKFIWNPNPQLGALDLGQVSVYTWKDKAGKDWRGGLFKPSDYQPGRHYPLVIQTHGFSEAEFRPSGFFPTAFAARALAGAGMLVLQVADLGCMTQGSFEGPCAVSGYESAVNQLVTEGTADPKRIGIVGFSRTCFYVMEALTTSSIKFKAANITDGVTPTYFQFLVGFGQEIAAVLGAKPFGEGLQQWLKRSPGFNLDKVNAPLMVVTAEGPAGVLLMWEPYAGLRYLEKPVDLIVLNTEQHVLTNPAVRMASQGGSVDWFRFWLQDYEDPNPGKAQQYARWRELRKMQAENEKKSAEDKNTAVTKAN